MMAGAVIKATHQPVFAPHTHTHTLSPHPLCITSDKNLAFRDSGKSYVSARTYTLPRLVFIVLSNWNIVWNKAFIHSSCDAQAPFCSWVT